MVSLGYNELNYKINIQRANQNLLLLRSMDWYVCIDVRYIDTIIADNTFDDSEYLTIDLGELSGEGAMPESIKKRLIKKGELKRVICCDKTIDDSKKFVVYVDEIMDILNIGDMLKPLNTAIHKKDVLQQNFFSDPLLYDDKKVIWNISHLILVINQVFAFYEKKEDQDKIRQSDVLKFLKGVLQPFIDFCAQTENRDDIYYADIVIGGDRKVNYIFSHMLYQHDYPKHLTEKIWQVKVNSLHDLKYIPIVLKTIKHNATSDDTDENRTLMWRIFAKNEFNSDIMQSFTKDMMTAINS